MATAFQATDTDKKVKRLVTKDFYQAVTFYALGYKVTRVFGLGSDQEITLADVREADVLAYMNDELQISPRKIFDAFRTMKGVVQEARASQPYRGPQPVLQAAASQAQESLPT